MAFNTPVSKQLLKKAKESSRALQKANIADLQKCLETNSKNVNRLEQQIDKVRGSAAASKLREKETDTEINKLKTENEAMKGLLTKCKIAIGDFQRRVYEICGYSDFQTHRQSKTFCPQEFETGSFVQFNLSVAGEKRLCSVHSI